MDRNFLYLYVFMCVGMYYICWYGLICIVCNDQYWYVLCICICTVHIVCIVYIDRYLGVLEFTYYDMCIEMYYIY